MRILVCPAALMSLLGTCQISSVEGDELTTPVRTPAGRMSAATDSPTMTIQQLEAIAVQNNPTLDHARAETWKAHGRYVQAGLYPNPEVGYAASEVGNEGRAGQQGVYFQQEFVFGGKLALSQNFGAAERTAADHALALQELRVRNNVRLEYYGILTAKKNR